MVTTVTCSTREVTVAHPLRVRILCQVTIQYELSGSLVVLARTCSVRTTVSCVVSPHATHRRILGSSPLGVST